MAISLHFKTNTLLKNLVGKDLINDDNIAIIELVKNSYDAGSESVVIEFENISSNAQEQDGKIIISDQGCGMDMEDIKNKWLNIAYSEKKTTTKADGAYYAGNKGVGRFSCDRLGKSLTLLTRKTNKKIICLEINWQTFEIENEIDLTIQEIPVSVREISEEDALKLSGLSSFPSSGTSLIISRPRSTWDADALIKLKRHLEKFLNPNQVFIKQHFRISLSAPEYEKLDADKPPNEKINGEIENQVFERLKFNATFIDTSISDDGKTLSTILSHEGKPVFRIVEINDVYPTLKSTRVVIYYLNPYKKAYFKRQTGIRLLDFGSIFLFLNGFRVSPYGEAGDDWLGIDRRRAQGHARYLGSRDVVGRIEVVDTGNNDNEAFMPISSREGLKETEEFKLLKNGLFIDVLRRLERFVVDGLNWDSVPEHVRTSLRNEDGLDWSSHEERYLESWDKKRERIGLSILALIGSSPKKITSFWFDPSLIENIQAGKERELQALVSSITGFDDEQLDNNLKKDLSKVAALLERKVSEAAEAKREVVSLQVAVEEQDQKIKELVGHTESYRAQTLFLKSVASKEVKDLMAFHHQILLDSTVIDNHLSKATRLARNASSPKDMLNVLEKISKANKRISAVAQFASKANFKAGTKKIATDIPAFFEQYLKNVAGDFVATGLRISTSNSVHEEFEVVASRIELSILIDNLLSNSVKADARNVAIEISKPTENSIELSFSDDGKGLSKDIPSLESIFELGITTTSGSGLGLYHAKEIIQSLGGSISAVQNKPKGLKLIMEISR